MKESFLQMVLQEIYFVKETLTKHKETKFTLTLLQF
jgi:hypothetical protein